MRAPYQRRQLRRFLLRLAAKLLVALLVVLFALLNALYPVRTWGPPRAAAAAKGVFECRFLDVGQGDCAVAVFPGGDALVVDAGDGSWRNTGKLRDTLRAVEPASLTFVATHADRDHFGGFNELLGEFPVRMLMLPAVPSDSSAYRGLLSEAEEAGIFTKTAKRYEVLTFGEAYAVCISPYSAGEDDENDSSTVLYLSYAGVQFLFGADITEAREEKLAAEYAIDPTLFDYGDYSVRLDDVDVLKVSHHGSAYSSSEAWLGLLRPEVAVISCGAGNPYGHPAGETLSRLASCGSEIYRTDELGDIVVSVYPDGNYTVGYEK